METDVVVVGGGPAGLAVSACLSRAGVPCVALERASSVGASWRSHYQRLHLHTVKKYSELPFVSFPDDAPRYVPRAQVVDYLEAYAERLRLPVRLGEAVTSVRREDGAWVTQGTSDTWRSRAVVVATGYNAVPNRPTWPGQAEYKGKLLHSAEYRSAASFKGQRVLVVGFGNTGAEIALDLTEQGAEASVAVRSPTRVVPRDFLGRPSQETTIRLSFLPLALKDAIAATASRLAFGDLSKHGLAAPKEGPITQILERGRVPVIDVGTVAMIKAGRIRVEPDLDAFTSSGVRFKGGSEKPYDAVILATGYRTGLERFLESRYLDDRGYPRAASTDEGLHFVGFRLTSTGVLREIGLEARQVAATLARPRLL